MGASGFSDGTREQTRREAMKKSDIATLKDRVVEAAKAVKAHPPAGAWRELSDAVTALQAAEEAAKRPNLRGVHEFCCDEGIKVRADSWAGFLGAVRARDAEWIEAIRRLRRFVLADYGPAGDAEGVALEDILKLAE